MGKPHERGAATDKEAVRGELQLLKCAKRLEQYSGARFRDAHGGSLPRFDVLATLDRAAGGSLPTSTLARELIASQGNITRLLDRMEADGLVTRGAHSTDRRVSVIALTNEGRRQFRRMATDHERWMGEIFGVLSAAETRQLTRLLGKIRSRIDTAAMLPDEEPEQGRDRPGAPAVAATDKETTPRDDRPRRAGRL